MPGVISLMRVASIATGLLLLFAGTAHAQRVQLSVERGDIYAGLPFILSVAAEGFEESPEPVIQDLKIAGAKVEFLGVSPNVSSSITIINGRRSESRRVSFVYRYRVIVAKAGTYSIPPVVVTQAAKKAESRSAQFRAGAIETTQEMKLRLSLPNRPVWVGESFEMTIDWYLRTDPNNPKFVIPLFDLEGQFRVAAPEPAGRRTLAFRVGDREIELPYERDKQILDGVEYNRFRFFVNVTPQRAGAQELPPAAVVSRLATGYRRDAFGFRTPRLGIFKAEDEPRSLNVKPLPASGKPSSFAGAVGSRFSMDVQASRTVVRVGDPIELQFTIRGEGGLEGLRLPSLAGDHALPKASFEVPEELAPGELQEDGAAKVFKVTIRLRATDVREIPELPFSYFDPQRGQYVSIKSQPIALSIAGSNMVGASDVVSNTGASKAATEEDATASAAQVLDADLSLSNQNRSLRTVLSTGSLTPILAALYAIPLLILVGRVWQLRTRDRRDQGSELKRAHKKVREELDRARSGPARDSAPALAAALRALSSATGQSIDKAVMERLETEGYRPDSATEPLAADLLDEIRAQAKAMASRGKGKAAASTAAAVLFMTMATSAMAEPYGAQLDHARDSYEKALAQEQRDRRVAAFRVAESQFRGLNSDYPARPELLTDWGSAALGARDFGTAALAYKRALALDPGLERALANLRWLRQNGPAKGVTTSDAGAADALFFWHRRLTRAQKHLLAAFAFACFALLAAPLASSSSRRRLLRRLSIAPLLVTVVMLASLAVSQDAGDQIVVTDGSAILRSADSPGAPAARPLPPGAGAEAEAIELRDDWVRVRLDDGSTGWLRQSAVAFVIPRT